MNDKTQNLPGIILLVEDEEFLRRSIEFTLRRQGYKILQAATVREAINLMDTTGTTAIKISLIITDLQLPEKNGFELIRHAHQNAPGVPILVITGHRGQEERRELARLGITAVLDKPFDKNELLDRVNHLIV